MSCVTMTPMDDKYPQLRFHTNRPAPHEAGPTLLRRSAKLEQRVSGWNSMRTEGLDKFDRHGDFARTKYTKTEGGKTTTMHKPGSFK